MTKTDLGATRTGETWTLTLPKGKQVELSEEEAWAIGRDLWAKRVHLDPRLRANSTGPSVLEVLEKQLDEVHGIYRRDSSRNDPAQSSQLYGAIYGLAWAIGAMRDPYEDRRKSAMEQIERSVKRIRGESDIT